VESILNIFYIDPNPVIAAQYLVNSHCVKMILESAQLLSTAHRLLDGRMTDGKSKTGRNVKRYILDDARDSVLYSATHVNHPSAVWTRTSVENYLWLAEHFHALMDEYKYRYDKEHKCRGELSYMLMSPPHNLQNFDMTEMPCAMPDEYKVSGNPVESYRNYYRIGKAHIHAWKNRKPPAWIST